MSDFEVCPVGTVARLAQVEAECDALRMEVDALRAKRDEDRRREYGYSQQTVDAITKERDALRSALVAVEQMIDAAIAKKVKGGGNG